MFPLDVLLRRLVREGELKVIDGKGRAAVFGAGGSMPRVTIALHDPALTWRLAFYPSLHFGKAYTDGTLTIEEGTLSDLLALLLKNSELLSTRWYGRANRRAEEILRLPAVTNWLRKARKNVTHHYDLSSELYGLFLDEDRQYSCAYFRDPAMSLDEAQMQKKHHLASKLRLEAGQRVLDIGCGWGGLALYLAQRFHVHVTGLTLSTEQYRYAKAQAARMGLSDRVAFKLLDYRLEDGLYDRIVSVGMFEHVGRPHYRQFFRKLKALLRDDGVALLHTIGRRTPPSPINVWIRQNIFPGAYLPSLSQLVPIFEDLGLWLTDFENLRLHYAWTLNAWNRRFQASRETVAKLYDERFCRMWEFYLQSCEAGFLYSGLTVFQIQLTKEIGALPVTRDYMFEEEQRLRQGGACGTAGEQPRIAGE